MSGTVSWFALHAIFLSNADNVLIMARTEFAAGFSVALLFFVDKFAY